MVLLPQDQLRSVSLSDEVENVVRVILEISSGRSMEEPGKLGGAPLKKKQWKKRYQEMLHVAFDR